jgi:hypothetical protein
MKTYTPQTQLALTDLEDIPYGMDRYTLSIPNIRELRGGISRETAYAHARRWIEAEYAERRKGGYIVFTRKAFYHFNPPYKYHNLGDQNLPHHAEVNMVEFWLRKRTDMIVLGIQGQRITRYLLNQPANPTCPSKLHIPDLIVDILSVKTNKIVQTAIEVERSYKGPDNTMAALREYAACYEHAFYIASVANGVYGMVKNCIENLPDEMIPRFSLWKLDTIRVWQEKQFSSKPKVAETSGLSEE